MSGKRKDKKNRILHEGESQRKDGRYMYKYKDAIGQTKYVYSWRLDRNDVMPKGKRSELSLREKERQINKDAYDGIVDDAGDMTVVELVEKYLSLKNGVRHNTEANYRFILNVIIKDPFGHQRIDKIKTSDAKAWFVKLQRNGRGYSSIHAIRGVIRPAFQMAVEDDLLRKNPFDFRLATVVVNDSVVREAISDEDQERFLDFIKNDPHYCRYYDGVYVLFHTGLRISEFVGLTIKEIDFRNMKINVTHQLQRTRDMKYEIQDTKTTCGRRKIPMTPEVAQCFRNIIANRPKVKVEPMVDGYTGFLFLDKNNKPMVSLHWEKYFKRIVEKYNSTHIVQLPKITPHVCRHTFCTNMAKVGMNPKSLQYIMGHADIGVTLNVYTHVKSDDVHEEMLRLCANG